MQFPLWPFEFIWSPKGDSVGCIALWMLFCVRSVNLNFLCRFSVWWNLRILLSHSCWMFCTAYNNKVYLIHSAHVRAKRAEICFLASTLTSVNVGAILEIARGINKSNLTRCKVSCIWWRKGSTHALRPEGFGFKPRNAVLEKGTWLYWDITSCGKRVTGNLKKTLQFADTIKKKKLNRIFTVGATGIPRNKSWTHFLFA